jgi:FkbM family methyltransferase
LIYAQNHWIEIYDISSCTELYNHRIYEQETTEFFRNYLNKGDTVYDIGANIGYFSLEFARLTGKTGKVFCFEPHPEIYRVLESNIKRNNYNNITIFPLACGQYEGNTNLYLSNENEGNHKIVNTPNMSTSVEVEIATLDKFVKQYPPRIIKMDIEGAELLALKGLGADNLRDSSIDLMIEYHPYEMSFFEIDGSEILEFLSECNYKFYDLAFIEYPEVSISDITFRYKKEDFGITNLYCTKS